MKKKNSLLTFLCALVPGAGQMYLGLLKKGCSIMLAFTIDVAVTTIIPLFAIFLPVIWFYAFFDTFSLRSMTEEERRAQEQKFLVDADGVLGKDWRAILQKRHTVIGIACILFGAYLLFDNFISPILYRIFDTNIIYGIVHSIPTFVVSALIILLGVYLVKGGPKKTVPQDDDFIAYGGDKHE
mgnify:CR=1 FL=1